MNFRFYTMTAVRQAHQHRFWFSNKVINNGFKRESVPGLEFLGMGSKLDHIFRILFSVSTSNLHSVQCEKFTHNVSTR